MSVSLDLLGSDSIDFSASFGLRCLICATTVAVVGWMLFAATRRKSAATRHGLLTSMMIGLVACPFLVLATSTGARNLPNLLDADHRISQKPRPTSSWSPSAPDAVPRDSVGETREIDQSIAGATMPERASAPSRDATSQSAVDRQDNYSSSGAEQRNRASTWATIRGYTGLFRFVLWTWLAGAFVGVLLLIIDRAVAWRLVRHSVGIEDPKTERILKAILENMCIDSAVDVRCSEHVRVPVTVGILQHTILLPIGFAKWPAATLRIALSHELVHVERRDVRAQWIAQCACVVYWFHPLVWMAHRQMRREREKACDDVVLNSGASASDYADLLIDFARSVHRRHQMPLSATGIIGKSEIAMRVRHLLSSDANRAEVSLRARRWRIGAFTVLTVMAAVVAPSVGIAELVSRTESAESPFFRESQDDARDDSQDEFEGAAAYRGRTIDKAQMLRVHGGTAETEAAVARGLQWIREQQAEDGSWRFAGTEGFDIGTRVNEYPMAATAFALLAFQGAGQTHQEGQYREVVERGMRWLLEQQRESGEFREQSLYAHAICMMAVADLYGMTGDPDLREAAQRAVDFAAHAQDPVTGGWRYSPRQSGDTSVTGWFAIAFAAAVEADLEIPEEVIPGITRYLDGVQSRGGEAYPYLEGSAPTSTMSAVGLLSRQWTDRDGESAPMMRGIEALHEAAGFDATKVQYYYWFHAAQAMRNVGGDPWDRWNEAMAHELPRMQELDGDDVGSWSPVGAKWASHHGPLFSTCLAVLTLEVYYRFESPLK